MTERYNVVVTRRIPEVGLAVLRDACDVWVNPEDRPLTRDELLDRIRNADGVLGQLTDRIDAGFFDAAPQLRGYANYAVGFDNIDVAEATKRRVPVSNTPDVLTIATAEMAWALLFAVARHVVPTDAATRSGTWPGWGPLLFLGTEITGKTLGIFGPGRIGTAMLETQVLVISLVFALVIVCIACNLADMGECGHAFRSVYDTGNRWLGWRDAPVPMVHSVEFFWDLLQSGKIKIAHKFDEAVTIHDPCNIVRGRGLTEKLREVTKALCREVVEMEPHGEHNYCCAAGGGVINCGPPFKNVRMTGNRVKADQLRATGVSTVIAPCHNCHEQAAKLLEAERALAVRQVADGLSAGIRTLIATLGEEGGIFGDMPCFIAITDREGRIIAANQLHRERFGNKIGLDGRDLYAGSGPTPAATALASGRGHRENIVMLDKRGREIPVLVHTAPILDNDGEVELVLEVAVDVTEVRRLRDELKSTQARFRQLFDEAPCFIAVVDRDLRIAEANRLFKLGFSSDPGAKCHGRLDVPVRADDGRGTDDPVGRAAVLVVAAFLADLGQSRGEGLFHGAVLAFFGPPLVGVVAEVARNRLELFLEFPVVAQQAIGAVLDGDTAGHLGEKLLVFVALPVDLGLFRGDIPSHGSSRWSDPGNPGPPRRQSGGPCSRSAPRAPAGAARWSRQRGY